ncbi:TonB-linked SusC/RagA family outer membrane protein [Chitinophaga skermanii]|uniref:TonB-linked SusC/RagA family outer membrane protein n=1 Tax=Chitinophaga skermanii TaxID=331697 RepID=A0A327QXU6_9BACT|nr:SusC/RagA family TonB-linked outer membrane protein [Chitinophaga skermanii]RAJ06467.1 TonB-linked SusC/RagA family outer membrane protein [Chitinophaga skermanii]
MTLLLNGQLLRLLSTKAPLDAAACCKRGLHSVAIKRLIMQVKLITLLLFLFLVDAQAKVVAQKVTINVKNASVASVFKSITRQTGYVFFYNDDVINAQDPVTISVTNEDLDVVLRNHFPKLALNFTAANKTIAVKAVTAPIAGSRISNAVSMQGKVLDAQTGLPIPLVNIVVKNSQTGVVSNETGNFSIIAPKGSILVFSCLGYETQQVEIKAATDAVIRMKPAARTLGTTEIVTGIYNRKKDSYTGAVVTISQQELKKMGNANLFQSLRNIAPAMFVDNFALGSSPNALPTLQLRGTSTLGDLSTSTGATLKGNYIKSPNEPLFILDGFEATLERIFDLDINRIESVTILKDAASKAIYGSRAANGVIVVETKKNTSGTALVTYNASLDIELPDLSSYNLANATEKIEAERIDGMYLSNDPAAAVALQQLYESRRKLALEGLNTDWIAKPLRNGVGQKHTIGVELGGNELRLLADISYRDVQGAMIGSNRKNITANMQGSYRLKNVLFRNIMSINSNQTKESPYGKFSDYVKMNPYWKATNLDGSIPFYAEIGPNAVYTNPMHNATINTNITTDYLNFTDNFYLEWTLRPGLKAVARTGVDIKTSGADEFYPASHTNFVSYTSEEMKKRKGAYTVNNGKSTFLSGDFNINYSKTIRRHTFFSNIGFNVSERKYFETIHHVEGFSSDKMDNILFGSAYAYESKPTGTDGLAREIGFLGAVSYMYDNRFMTDVTLRRSASSLFGADKKWGNFWSVGLGYNLHNEQFIRENLPFFEQFKIRGSVGVTGNPNFKLNASVPTYLYYLEAFYQGYPGSYLSNLANSSLQWESKLDYNIGADFKIQRLTGRIDYYQGFTKNLVTVMTMPGSTGFNSLTENLGKVKNEGMELNLNYLVYQKGRNYLGLNFGVETNKNKIIELSNAMKSYNSKMDELAGDKSNGKPVKKYVDGLSMNAIWAVPSLGIDPATGNEIYLKQDGSTTYNWNANDMRVVGNSLPTYQGTFGISGEFNRIGFSLSGRYLGGGDMYNATLVDRVENVDMNYNVDRRVLTGRWLYPGQVVQFKRLGTYDKPNENGSVTPTKEMTRATSRFVQKRNEVTFGAVNLYYYLSDDLAHRLRLQQLKVAMNLNEVGTISTIRIERGTDYPFAKTLSFSLSATF